MIGMLKEEVDRRTAAIRGCGEEIVRLRQTNKVASYLADSLLGRAVRAVCVCVWATNSQPAC